MPILDVAVLVGVTALAAAGEPSQPSPEAKAAMQELWRRGECLLSSVYQPAERAAAVPKDLGGLPALEPRVYANKGALLCYAVDGRTLWAADDQTLYRVDAASGKLARRYDAAAGLPEAPIQAIAPAGSLVWLATRTGLAKLDLATDRIVPVEGVRFTLARLAAGPTGLWVVSDAGAWHCTADGACRALADFPERQRLVQVSGSGFWTALWQRRLEVLIPSIFATDDGLYAIVSNRLVRFDPQAGQWVTICDQAWQAIAAGRTVWAIRTAGVLRYDAATGERTDFPAGKGPADGRPVAMAAAQEAFYLASEPAYDAAAKRFTGGGISRFADGKWTVIQEVDGTDIRCATALLAEGDEVWAASKLFDGVIQLGAHPGMAHVKRWVPKASGVAVAHFQGGQWTVLKREGLKTEPRWVLGQRGTLARDLVGPDTVERLCRAGDGLWGIYRIVPQTWYAGYFVSAGRLAASTGGDWTAPFDVRTAELDLAGEQPDLMLISHSHGPQIVLADGHPIVLGLESVAGRLWAVCEGGLFVHDPATDRLTATEAVEGFRGYWRISAAAAGAEAVWFGGDGGTVSRFLRQTGRYELLGVVPGRRIVAMAAEGQGVAVKTAPTTAQLPASLRAAPTLPVAEVIAFDGATWAAVDRAVAGKASAFSMERRANWLTRDGRRVGYLKGVFRPEPLCDDEVGRRIWLATYDGVAWVPMPAAETP